MSAEILEGDAVEIPQSRALEPQRTQVIMGSASLALMGEAEFQANLTALALQRTRGDQIKRALMVEGTDYGTVPGVPKAFLWKSGAETLDKAFGLVATFTLTRVLGDGESSPPYSFHAHALIHLGTGDGPVVGEGFGTCTPWESRYRYRKGERLCPNCGKPAVIKGKAEFGGGWVCWRRKDGCDSKWRDGDPAIEGQDVGQIENENPWDLENTIAKMAEKRAHVDGTIRATGTSGLFTQDDDSPAVQPLDSPAPKPVVAADGSLIGIAQAGDQQTSDFLVRQTPDGPELGFRLRDTSGKGGTLVECLGPLAVQLAHFREAVIGQTVTVWGTLSPRSFTRKDGSKQTYQVLAATRVRVPEIGDLPTDPTPEAPSADLPWDLEAVDLAEGRA